MTVKTMRTKMCPDCGAVTQWELGDAWIDPREIIDEPRGPQWYFAGGQLCDCASLREQAELDANQAEWEREQAARSAEDARIAAFAGPPLDCWSDGLERRVDCSAICRSESYDGAGDGTPWGRVAKLGSLVDIASAFNLPRLRLLLDGSGVLWNAGAKEVRLPFMGG